MYLQFCKILYVNRHTFKPASIPALIGPMIKAPSPEAVLLTILEDLDVLMYTLATR